MDQDKPKSKDWDAIREKAEALAESSETQADQSNIAPKGPEADTPVMAQPEALEYPDHEQLEHQLTESEQLAHEYKDKAMRLAAEMENLRKRQEQETIKMKRYGALGLAKDLVALFDSFDGALSVEGADEGPFKAMREGIVLLRESFIDTLKKHHVEEVNPLGEKFDPQYHEAMLMAPSDQPPGTIIEVLQKGFRLHDRVLRPARVIVAKTEE